MMLLRTTHNQPRSRAGSAAWLTVFRAAEGQAVIFQLNDRLGSLPVTAGGESGSESECVREREMATAVVAMQPHNTATY